MRRKVANTIEGELYQAAKEQAYREGRHLNELIEDALRSYLTQSKEHVSVVRETQGTFDVPWSIVREVAEEEIYGTE